MSEKVNFIIEKGKFLLNKAFQHLKKINLQNTVLRNDSGNENAEVPSSLTLRGNDTTADVILDVVFALIPAAIFGCVIFGWRAAAVVATTTATAVIFEFLWNLIFKKTQTIGNFSALLTGLILGMSLPPTIPLWMALFGSFIAIIAVKQFLGGFGRNFINPAVTALAILTLCFPAAMQKFVNPSFITDNVITLKDEFFGFQNGFIGETSAFLLIIGGIYLTIRRIINPIIPLSFIATAGMISVFNGQNFFTSIFGGSLALGAIFMANDFATCPATNLGKLIFGIGCGVLTFTIRHFTNLHDGVVYAIFIMNLLTPFINALINCKPFGYDEEKIDYKNVLKSVFDQIVVLFEKIKVFAKKHITKLLGK